MGRVILVGVGLLALVGCNSRTPMRVWGDVSYEGKPISDGQIVFTPMNGTPGPTTGGSIADGRYEVPVKNGPWRGGTYQIEITALAKNGAKLPNPTDPSGPPVELADNYIPAQFNHQSELRVTISANAAQNKFDFHLRDKPGP